MTIDEFNFSGKKAIVRVDFNVPLDENGNVTDDTRIRGALPTLKKILADGGSVIMMSHMGKPKGKVNPKLSLQQIVGKVSEHLGVDVKFAPDCGNAEKEAAALQPGEALLLENLRFYPEEEGKPVGVEKGTPEFDEAKKAMKESQKKFAQKLASYADVYVNDAFGTAHRRHASTAVIADYFEQDAKMLGYLMEKEVTAIDNVMKNAQHPFTAIIGGSKVSSKLGVRVSAKEVKSLGAAEEIICHFLLPGGEETGICRDVFPHSGGYFVPELRQKNPVLRILGNFVNIASVHAITCRDYTIFFGLV